MTIPFLDLFRKLTGRSSAVTTETATPAPTQTRAVRPKKSDAERLSKTVMPNATRSLSAPDPFRSAAATAAAPRSSLPLELGARGITASSPKSRASQLPPALARALEPKIERTIALRVADLLDVVPNGFIKPVEILDTKAVVSLKASEIEKGMPDKHPMISLPSLYQQVPEIFLRSVRPDDQTRVELPYEKVLEQFHTAQVRVDQVRDPVAPHVDTPILKATIEDSEKFGTKIEPIETSSLPPVPVKHATAQSIADAEPDAMAAFVQRAATSTSPGPKVISLHSPELAPKRHSSTPSSTASPLKIPLEISEVSPNGTGASASERVPASSGPPVPTSLPFSPQLEETTAPAPIKLSEPVARAPHKQAPISLKPTDTPVAKPEEKLAVDDGRKIELSLKAVLKSLPAFQLDGDVAAVSDDARVALPLALIEPQLASGRILVAPDVLQEGMPQQYRQLLLIDEAETRIGLPLEEVLKNLPATVLKLRDDQEHFHLEKDFETPFSIKAREDAEKFAAEKKTEENAAAEKSSDRPTVSIEPKEGAEKVAAQEKSEEIASVEKSPESSTELKVESVPTKATLDPKEVVSEANVLAGVKACAITFSDGLSLAGELPEETEADGLCAMAPSVMERISQHVRETKLGNLVAVTVHTSDSAISFFAHENICLAALHADGSLPSETRTKLADMVAKLSKQYTKTE